jgi:hypothetical protein
MVLNVLSESPNVIFTWKILKVLVNNTTFDILYYNYLAFILFKVKLLYASEALHVFLTWKILLVFLVIKTFDYDFNFDSFWNTFQDFLLKMRIPNRKISEVSVYGQKIEVVHLNHSLSISVEAA